MPKKPGPTLRAQWLGQQLRELRESCDLTLKEAGEYLQRDASMVSRFETADWPIRRGDVLALLDLYGVADEKRRSGLIRLSEEVWQKGWWEQYADALDRQFIDYPWLEGRADLIRSYDAMILPGLLQTRAYAETLIKKGNGAVSAQQLTQWIDFRMERQRVLDRGETPRLEAILDESALRRPIGGPEVMRAQLARLRELAQRPNIDLRVLPLRAGWHAGLDGAFTIFEMPEPYPEVAYVDNLAGRFYIEQPEVERFVRVYHDVRDTALDLATSAELISTEEEGLQ